MFLNLGYRNWRLQYWDPLKPFTNRGNEFLSQGGRGWRNHHNSFCRQTHFCSKYFVCAWRTFLCVQSASQVLSC